MRDRESQYISDKFLFLAEKLSFVVIFIPFVSIILWVFLKDQYFFFFPIAMFTFFPTGILAWAIQRIRISRKHPQSGFSSFTHGMGILATTIGVFMCLAICVTTIN